MQIPLFILAAGASRRLGQPKQLLQIDGQSLIRRQCRVALEADLGPVFVVVGCHAQACMGEFTDLPVTAVLNDEWEEGLAASIRVAAAKAAEIHAAALLLMHVDQYALTADALGQLAERWRQDAARPHLARDGDHLGPPAVIPAAYFPALAALSGDRGARGVLGEVVETDVGGAAADIDDPSHLPR